MREIADTFVHPTAVIGGPFRPLQGFVKSKTQVPGGVNFLGKHYVGPYCIIYDGAEIEDEVILDEYVRVGREAKIGKSTLLTHRASVGAGAIVGDRCVIGGLVSENCTVENDVKFFGKAVHSQNEPCDSWDHSDPEPSATIRSNSFVAFDSLIVGGVSVGPNSYVVAGAIVSIDVPERCIAFGKNKIILARDWNGPLKDSRMFR